MNTSTQSTVLPICTLRLRLCDAAGNNLSTSDIVLTALAINGTRDPIFNFSGLPLNYRFTYNATGRFYEYTFYIGGLPGGVDTRCRSRRSRPRAGTSECRTEPTGHEHGHVHPPVTQ